MSLRTSGISASGITASLASQASAAHRVANVAPATFAGSFTDLTDSSAYSDTRAITKATPGTLIVTGNPLDFAIGGSGFFVLEDPQGHLLLTRSGSFTIDDDGFLVDPQGRRLTPEIGLPKGARVISVNRYGDIIFANGEPGRRFAGTVELGTVANPRGLQRIEDGNFIVTDSSGALVRGRPGESGFGLLVQGGLESHNVDLLGQTLSSVASARALNANSRIFKLASSMAGELLEVTQGQRRQTRKVKFSGDIDLTKSQLAGLINVLEHETSPRRVSNQPVSPDLHARLSARRLTAPQIAARQLQERRFVIARFNDAIERNFGGRGGFGGGLNPQEVRLARASARELLNKRLGRG